MSELEYKLEKSVWTTVDFDLMGWHDCRVHGLALDVKNNRLLVDIDYIFKWIDPPPGEIYYSFWVSPCTLVFENVYDLKIDVADASVDILAITREDVGRPRNADFIGKEEEWTWILDCVSGNIQLRSVGYKQYVRALPRHITEQHFDLNMRGGVSFSETACIRT
ncbi:MAG: hypothetical protein ACXU8U_08265 [Asticcacaulis sp.]